MRTTFVHLVRHGEVHNPERVSYGRLPGFPLSAEGRAQAQVAARYLRETGGRVTRLVSSPLERARESAGIVADELGVAPSVDERLIELGSWRDGLPRALSPLRYARRFFDPTARARSEPVHAVMRRMRAVVDEAHAGLEEENTAAVLVSHQSPIWMCRVAFERAHDRGLMMSVAPWLFVSFPCALASVTTLVFEGRRLAGVRYFQP